MLHVKRIAMAVFGLAILAGCGTIDHYETAKQPLGKELSAGVGDVVLKLDRHRDLANVAGKADLFGRKTNEGYTEVRFMGLEDDGTLVFARKDITIHTNETTMSRARFIPVPTTTTTSVTGMAGTTPVSGVGTSTGTTFVPTRGATAMVIPSDTIAIRLKPGQGKSFRVGGYLVEVADADSAGLVYRLERLPQ